MKLTRLAAVTTLVCGALAACRTANGPASVKEDTPPPPPAVPVVALEGAFGSAAAALYEKTSLAEANDMGTLKKAYSGKLVVHCTQAGPSAAAAKFSCAAASGDRQAPAFLAVDGDPAKAMWDAFAGASVYRPATSSYEKTFEAAAGDYVCARAGGTYRCTAGAPGSANGVAAAPEVLSILGGRASVAGVMWNSLSAAPTMAAGVATKSVTGRIALKCSIDGAPACAASRPAAGAGTPPAPFLKLDGPTAKGLFEALKVAANGNAKAFTAETGELSCGKGGNEQYSCTLKGR